MQNLAWWASTELGLRANTKLDLVEQYETGLGGPDKTRLDGPVRNWAWWTSTKLGLVGQTKLGLMGQTKLGLMGQYGTGLRGILVFEDDP